MLDLLGRAQHGARLGLGLGPFGFGLESATIPAAACTYSVPFLITPVRIAMATSISPP